MHWIYLSPHLDDVALSCGGLVWEQARAGDSVEVWTVCAADPPPGEIPPLARAHHESWGLGRDAPRQRREEDRRASALLGVKPVYLRFADCIYRRSAGDGRPLYDSLEGIFGPVHPEEAGLAAALARELEERIPEDSRLVSPLAVGGHIDHRLTRKAAEALGRQLWYYEDYPYLVEHESWARGKAPLDDEPGWASRWFPISEEGLRAWQDSVAAYASQISTFWPDLAGMKAALISYHSRERGVRLWYREVSESP